MARCRHLRIHRPGLLTDVLEDKNFLSFPIFADAMFLPFHEFHSKKGFIRIYIHQVHKVRGMNLSFLVPCNFPNFLYRNKFRKKLPAVQPSQDGNQPNKGELTAHRCWKGRCCIQHEHHQTYQCSHHSPEFHLLLPIQILLFFVTFHFISPQKRRMIPRKSSSHLLIISF